MEGHYRLMLVATAGELVPSFEVGDEDISDTPLIVAFRFEADEDGAALVLARAIMRGIEYDVSQGETITEWPVTLYREVEDGEVEVTDKLWTLMREREAATA